MEFSVCENCGKPMNNPSDFGGRITSNRYCRDCTDSYGNLKTFGETIPRAAKSPAKRENLIFWIRLKYLRHLHRRRIKRIRKQRPGQ